MMRAIDLDELSPACTPLSHWVDGGESKPAPPIAARTVADLAGQEQIDSAHLAEAVQYRRPLV